MKVPKAEIKKRIDDIGNLMGLGYTSTQIIAKLGITWRQFSYAKQELAKNIEREAGTLWVTFLKQYQRHFQEVQLLRQRAKEKNNLNAEVGAIRLAVDLTDKMATFAQSIGLVRQAPQEVTISLKEHAASWERLFNFRGIEQKDLVSAN